MTDTSRVLDIPEVCLVVLVGASGSGKSTFAAQHFGRFEAVSSDFCRGLVSNEENDQSATGAAFDVLHYIVGKRLEAGLLTVVDATNVQKPARQALVQLARNHDVLPVAIVFDLPESVCIERNAQRQDRSFGSHVIRRQRDQLRRSLRGLGKEGFRKVHKLATPAEVENVVIERTRLLNDFRDERGPFDVIGDVHGCRIELEALLTELGYTITRDEQGRAIDAVHPGRKAVFVGDLIDRGPDSPGVLRLAMGMVANGNALAVPGNHENKLVRALRGRNVQTTHGLAETLEQLGKEPPEFSDAAAEFCDKLVSHLVLDDGKLVVAHAGLKESYHGRASGRVRSFALYGDTTGETDEFGLPVRYPWADEYRGNAMVLYGHTPMPDVEWINNTMCLDTGCVFGGKLTALRYPEKEIVSVPAQQVWYEPAKPLSAAPSREADLLSIDDVLGKRIIETAHHGRVTVKEESAAGALEVMSRFAVDPRWLLYLPPTMAPPATATEPGYLEYPTQAFEAFRADGVTELICEEKHMGSRAVALIRRDSSSSCFGLETDGVVWTRTGRQFFDDGLTAQLVARLRDAITAVGLWDELGSDWVLLDCEIMPWSAKALDLLRHQYAAVGAAGRAALPAAEAALQSALASGKDVEVLLNRTRRRLANVGAFSAAYRKYCWPVEGLTGIRVAPFQVLAAHGQTFHDRPHLWHLAIADRLATADELFVPTRRLVIDASNEASSSVAIDWWLDLTAAGGEGMVVKPAANLTRSRRRGVVQPGIKVRGREYLRIIYGPDYTEPHSLDRLRNRGLGHKRSLALREYALGLEALERVARGEPMWRVHEVVFAILACESEPVDPRL